MTKPNSGDAVASRKSRTVFYTLTTWGIVTLSCIGVVYYLLKLLFLSQFFLANAERVTGAELLAFGEFSDWPAQESNGETDREAKKLPAPSIQSNSTSIAASLNKVFGAQFLLQAVPKVSRIPVTLRIEHPRFTDAPSPSNKTIDEWEAYALAGEPSEIAWLFEYEWEMVPGVWRFSVIYKGRELVTQSFEVEIPDANETDRQEDADSEDEARISL